MTELRNAPGERVLNRPTKRDKGADRIRGYVTYIRGAKRNGLLHIGGHAQIEVADRRKRDASVTGWMAHTANRSCLVNRTSYNCRGVTAPYRDSFIEPLYVSYYPLLSIYL